MAEINLTAVGSSIMAGAEGGLITMVYDPTGLATVTVCAWPIIGWTFDVSNPINPAPIVMGNPVAVPPATGAILSPPWAHVVNEFAIYIPASSSTVGGWRGTLGQLLTWLATNNNAKRKIIGQFTVPPLSNAYNDWARANQSLIGA
jgi:hypothetical protein